MKSNGGLIPTFKALIRWDVWVISLILLLCSLLRPEKYFKMAQNFFKIAKNYSIRPNLPKPLEDIIASILFLYHLLSLSFSTAFQTIVIYNFLSLFYIFLKMYMHLTMQFFFRSLCIKSQQMSNFWHYWRFIILWVYFIKNIFHILKCHKVQNHFYFSYPFYQCSKTFFEVPFWENIIKSILCCIFLFLIWMTYKIVLIVLLMHMWGVNIMTPLKLEWNTIQKVKIFCFCCVIK